MKYLSRFAMISMISLSVGFPLFAHAQPLEISASEELIWDQNKGVYEAIGDASAMRGAQSIAAELLQAFYDENSTDQDITRIIATDNVKFTDVDMKGQGAKLDYDVAKNFYELLGPNARIQSKDGTAKAQKRLTYDRGNGIIIAEKQGHITLSDGRILTGDFIEITLTATEEIETVNASGNVYVRQTDGKEAYSQKGTYNTQTGKALLTGDVKIVDGESILNGQKAEIDFNSGISRLLAEDGNSRVSGTLVTSGQ